MLSTIYSWLDRRLRIQPLTRTLLDEPIPGGASWVYVFGSATLFLFGLQALTGMFLALYYVPSPDAAYDTVQYIQQEVRFGWFVRGLHHWGASAVMVAVGQHLLLDGEIVVRLLKPAIAAANQLFIAVDNWLAKSARQD